MQAFVKSGTERAAGGRAAPSVLSGCHPAPGTHRGSPGPAAVAVPKPGSIRKLKNPNVDERLECLPSSQVGHWISYVFWITSQLVYSLSPPAPCHPIFSE